jgi:signal transduction histidine kinase
MSVRRIEAAARVRDILSCASEAAECELLSAQLAESLRSPQAARGVLESLRQDMEQRIAATRLHLEMAARRIAVADLVVDFLGLLETEARVSGVELVPDRMEPVLAIDDVRALSRRLLNSSLNAIQRSARHGTIHVDTGTAGQQVVIRLRGVGARDKPFECTVQAPLLT